jgi:hypothetical protein
VKNVASLPHIAGMLHIIRLPRDSIRLGNTQVRIAAGPTRAERRAVRNKLLYVRITLVVVMSSDSFREKSTQGERNI